MKPMALLIAACGIVVACDGEVEDAVTPVEPPPFVLFGVVHDEDGARVSGATVEITEGRYRDWNTTTDEQGRFLFAGVRGDLVLRISKLGYEGRLHRVRVNSDQLIEVTLDRTVEIELGKTISALADGPPCDPIRWDANAPCRRFIFIPPSSGQLVITVTWNSGADLDATMVTAFNEYLAYSSMTGATEITLQGIVVAGVMYEIRVNSYYQIQEFDLKADLHVKMSWPPAESI